MRAAKGIFMAGLIFVSVTVVPADDARADGWYLAVDFSVSATDDPSGSDGFTTELSRGLTGGVAGGYRYGRFRFEAEMHNQMFSIRDQNAGGVPRDPVETVDGSLTINALMASGYVDFDIGGGWRPYVGAGAGLASVVADYRFEDVCVFPLCGVDSLLVDDEDWVPAFQARLGVAYQFQDNAELYVGYRYFAAGDPTFTDTSGNSFVQDGLTTNVAEFGVRLQF